MQQYHSQVRKRNENILETVLVIKTKKNDSKKKMTRERRKRRRNEGKHCWLRQEKKSSGWGPMGIQDPIFLQQLWGARSYGCCWCTCSYCPFCCWIKINSLSSGDTDHSSHSDRTKQANSHPNTAVVLSLQSYNTTYRTPQSSNHHLITLSADRSQSIKRAGVSSHSNLSPVSSNMCSPQTNVSLQSKRQTPVLTQTPENSFTPSSRSSHNNEPRRGLHFDSARQVAEVSSDEEDTSPDDPVEDDHGQENRCCREQWLENKALRNRLQKIHRQLNIACKLRFRVFL